MQLVLPSIEYEQSFREALEEFRKEPRGKEIEDSLISRFDKSADFADFVEKTLGRSEGKYLPPGFVPVTEYWLIDGERFTQHHFHGRTTGGISKDSLSEDTRYRKPSSDKNGAGFIGKVNIRHRLNKNLLKAGGHIGYTIRPSERRKGYGTLILRLALPKAKALGIKKALITCYEDNIGSRKIIEANGGVLEDTATTNEGVVKRRYWITIK